MLVDYRQHAAERAALGIPPLPLSAQQTAELIELIKSPPAGEDAFLLDLLTHRVPPGVDDAAKVKASFLAAVAHGDLKRRADVQGQGDRTAGHDGRRLQRQAADRPARRRRGRRRRRQGAEAHAADVRRLPRRGREGQGRQREGQGSDPELGRRRVVHQPPRGGTRRSPSPCSRCRARPTPTTCRPPPTPGAARTSRCTTWRC